MLAWLWILLLVVPVATIVGQPGFGASTRLPQATWLVGVLLLTPVLHVALRRFCGTWYVIDRNARTVTTGWRCFFRMQTKRAPLLDIEYVGVRWPSSVEISVSGALRYTLFLHGLDPIDLAEIDGEEQAREEALRIARFLGVDVRTDEPGRGYPPIEAP